VRCIFSAARCTALHICIRSFRAARSGPALASCAVSGRIPDGRESWRSSRTAEAAGLALLSSSGAGDTSTVRSGAPSTARVLMRRNEPCRRLSPPRVRPANIIAENARYRHTRGRKSRGGGGGGGPFSAPLPSPAACWLPAPPRPAPPPPPIRRCLPSPRPPPGAPSPYSYRGGARARVKCFFNGATRFGSDTLSPSFQVSINSAASSDVHRIEIREYIDRKKVRFTVLRSRFRLHETGKFCQEKIIYDKGRDQAGILGIPLGNLQIKTKLGIFRNSIRSRTE